MTGLKNKACFSHELPKTKQSILYAFESDFLKSILIILIQYHNVHEVPFLMLHSQNISNILGLFKLAIGEKKMFSFFIHIFTLSFTYLKM